MFIQFHVGTELLYCNTHRNRFVDGAIKFSEQNIIGSVVDSP
uniref:Uncharacterized protein n=1 Tax=Anguilla anguilla TaxID=7936 RepID=A0A0E9T5J0_ANGAN